MFTKNNYKDEIILYLVKLSLINTTSSGLVDFQQLHTYIYYENYEKLMKLWLIHKIWKRSSNIGVMTPGQTRSECQLTCLWAVILTRPPLPHSSLSLIFCSSVSLSISRASLLNSLTIFLSCPTTEQEYS